MLHGTNLPGPTNCVQLIFKGSWMIILLKQFSQRGYGTIRIIDAIDFAGFEAKPKWIIGFSDITILHSHILAVYNTQSIHGQMPLTIPDGSLKSLETLRKALFNEPYEISYESLVENRSGEGSGILTGGNLTLLQMMSGSISEQDYQDKILFLEDVGEYLYSIDRMILSFKRAGILAGLKGLIIGGFTDLKDNDIPFGQTAEQIIMDHVKEYDYPVCFNFPAGHIEDNRALIFGREVTLTVEDSQVSLKYSNQNS
jgi:muramoyltetrapeptide carboxypeptidase